MSERPVRIYLADLTHVSADGRCATESFPLNIGLVASYAKKKLGKRVEFRLFKYPATLFEALKKSPPDILGCSNYTWNSHLTEWACENAKKAKPDIITILGGTNYPFQAEGQKEFLLSRPFTDFHIFYEGEVAFTGFLERFMTVRSPAEMKQSPIPGIQFLSPERELVSGPAVERIKDLQEIPSPYTNGLLDEFFDGKCTPMMETTRGCPFTCNFCNAGDKYFTKVNMFSLDYIREELMYMAPRIAKAGVTNLTLADNNFGMFERDQEVARIFYDVQQKHHWPMQIIAWTGKNSKERVIKATEILGKSLSINMAVQSMDSGVLKKIKRSNISLDAYTGINEALTRQGRSMEAEMIVPLPGETLDTYMQGVEKLMGSGTKKITSYTLQLLYGTDYKDRRYREEHGYKGRWRIVPLDFGEYEGRKIFDLEEVTVSSKTLSFEDYLRIRSLALVTELTYNNYIFYELVKFLNQKGIATFDWVKRVWEMRDELPREVKTVFDDFIQETQAELWDSEEAILAHYRKPENYAKLTKGEAGGNVLFKYKAAVISKHAAPWIDFITARAKEVLQQRGLFDAPTQEEFQTISRHLGRKLAGVLREEGPEEDLLEESFFDIPRWSSPGESSPLSSYRQKTPLILRYYFTDLQKEERADHFSRYGSGPYGLAKILQRTPTFNRLFRQVEVRARDQG